MAPPAPKTKGLSLTSKVGPFPAWVYLAGAGVGVFVYAKKKKASSAATSTAAAAGGTTSAEGAGAGIGALGTEAATLSQYLAANASAPTTNPQWEANAEAVLSGEGYNWTQVQSALNVYLGGGALSSVQQEIVNAAIVAVGAPPVAPSSPASGTTTGPAPTTPAPVTAPPTAGAPPPPASSAPSPTGESTAQQALAKVTPDSPWVSEFAEPTGGFTGVSQKGHAYNVQGSQYFGGLGDPQKKAPAGTAVTAGPLPDGGYQITDASGKTLKFGPGSGEINRWAA